MLLLVVRTQATGLKAVIDSVGVRSSADGHGLIRFRGGVRDGLAAASKLVAICGWTEHQSAGYLAVDTTLNVGGRQLLIWPPSRFQPAGVHQQYALGYLSMHRVTFVSTRIPSIEGSFRYYGGKPSAAMVARDFNARARSELASKVAAPSHVAMTADGLEIKCYPRVESPMTVAVQNLGQAGNPNIESGGGTKPLTGSIGIADIIDSSGRSAIKIIRGSPL